VDDKKCRRLKANGRNKVVVSAWWVEVCNNTFALSAMLEGGYEIYMAADASGALQGGARLSMQRMIQAGVVPVTWQQVLLECTRLGAQGDLRPVMAIVREHSGATAWASTTLQPGAQAPQRISKVHEVLPAVAA